MSAKGEPANAGVVAPPPLIYLGALLVGFGLDAVLPSPSLPDEVAVPAGVALVIAGSLLAGSFVRTFRRAGTTVSVRSPASSLVTTGPYRITRNPGYLGFALIFAGIAVLAAPWAFVTLVAAVVVIDRMVIAREERYLEAEFGEPYREYKRRVRRWL